MGLALRSFTTAIRTARSPGCSSMASGSTAIDAGVGSRTVNSWDDPTVPTEAVMETVPGARASPVPPSEDTAMMFGSEVDQLIWRPLNTLPRSSNSSASSTSSSPGSTFSGGVANSSLETGISTVVAPSDSSARRPVSSRTGSPRSWCVPPNALRASGIAGQRSAGAFSSMRWMESARSSGQSRRISVICGGVSWICAVITTHCGPENGGAPESMAYPSRPSAY